MPLSWTDMEEVAAALQAAHPEAEPLEATLDQVRAWAGELPELADAAIADDKVLHAVQMLWYERCQADQQDVSG